jgi:beta-lactamase regulating signal transducer with metallopeptidase domain
MTKFAIVICLWIFVMGIILVLGEQERANSIEAERKERDLRAKLERTKKRADKKRAQKNS